MSFSNNFIFSIKKQLKLGFLLSSGRNFSGKICVHHKGGGLKRCNILIDHYKRINSYGFVIKIFKSFFFSSLLGLIVFENGLSSIILLSENIKLRDIIFVGSILPSDRNMGNGYCLPIFHMNLFSQISNIELYPYKGSILSRAAGTGMIITNKLKENKVSLKLKSGWNLLISGLCIASSGIISNSLHKFYNFKKAGVIRSLGSRPVVRGVAMNPCDHPHGGGEGKKSPPAAARSP